MGLINERIKERRLQLSMTLLQVAEQLGVKEATVQRYESGDIKNIKHETVLKLAQILHCDPTYLMGWTDTPRVDIKPAFNSLTTHEMAVIVAYRANPNMQTAVDKLLNVEVGGASISDDIAATIAATQRKKMPIK